MNQKFLFTLWGGLFSVCAAMGFIPDPAGVGRILLTLLSIAFFVPPALALYQAIQAGDQPVLRLIRNLSALSLCLTLVLLVLNFLSALRSETLGDILYNILTIVSSPMVCSGCWVLSLFLWACLLMVSLKGLRKKK